MLSLKDYKEIEKIINNIYNQLELEIIEDIALRITKIGFAKGVVLNNVKVLQQRGMLQEDVIELVGKYNHISAIEIRKIFQEAGVKTIKYDDEIYKRNGIKVNPFNQSPTLVKYLDTMISRTNRDLRNLTLTTVQNTQNQFINAVNQSYLEISTGYKSYSQSILDAVKKISQEGAYVIYKNKETGKERKDKIDVATRRAIITSISQTCGELQLQRAIENGWDLMQLTAHKDARPSHAEWQGKKVSISGKKGFLTLNDIGYKKVDGFKGINCYHDWYPTTNESKIVYTDKQLEEMNTKVKYNDKEISGYEAKQIQRGLERKIREDKRWIASLKQVKDDNQLSEKSKIELDKANAQYAKHTNELNDFLSQTGFNKDYMRLRIK